MKFTVPEKMPSRREFILLLLQTVFPDLDEDSTTYCYSHSCGLAAELMEMNAAFNADSDLFRLTFELSVNQQNLFPDYKPKLMKNFNYKNLPHYLLPSFCEPTKTVFKEWLNPEKENGKVTKSFESALFFAFLLLKHENCINNRIDCFRKCMEMVGITDIEENVAKKLFLLNWNELGELKSLDNEYDKEQKKKLDPITFTRLSNTPIILYATTMLVIFKLLGTYSPDKHKQLLETLYDMFRKVFGESSNAFQSMEHAEKALFNSIRFFEPRSIKIQKQIKPQDFFVFPVFQCGELTDTTPFSALRNASNSHCAMTVAKTGLGKSSMLQIATLCMLYDKYGTDNDTQQYLHEIAEKFDVPDDMFIISVPARMFSFCFQDERYKDWTKDFIDLFFNCMWRLSYGFNFYSTQSSRTPDLDSNAHNFAQCTVTDEMRDYVYDLARKGKLLLILDSFDEISSGDMRNAYLDTLRKFYNSYCKFPAYNEVGAHIILSSREMSPETMNQIESILKIDENNTKFEICPLNQSQRYKLITKWGHLFGWSDEEIQQNFEQIEENHYFLDYSVNPYMLSVVCSCFGQGLGNITKRLIDTLVLRMQHNNSQAVPLVQNILGNIVPILQHIAVDLTTTGQSSFSRQKLDNYIKERMDKNSLSDEEVQNYIEQLHEIFVTEVGLIVPADGNDNNYQFINNQIRYELAVREMRYSLEKNLEATLRHESMLSNVRNINEYVGLLIPLLCNINLENIQLAELLVSELAVHDFRTDEEDKQLIQAMLDLLFSRYGSNITAVQSPGYDDTQYVRRAQRILLMRLFTSKYFHLFEKEKREFALLPAFQHNKAWFSSDIINDIEQFNK